MNKYIAVSLASVFLLFITTISSFAACDGADMAGSSACVYLAGQSVIGGTLDGATTDISASNMYPYEFYHPVDRTTAAITYSPSGPYKAGDQVTITATFSYFMSDSPVPQIALSGANTLAAVNMTKVDYNHYTYTHTVASGSGNVTVSIPSGRDVSGSVVSSIPSSGANFEVFIPVMLSVSTSGSGKGNVTADLGTINWNGANGSAAFYPGSVVTLTASATTGSTFTGWAGACTGITNSNCSVTMDVAKNVTAIFNLLPEATVFGLTPDPAKMPNPEDSSFIVKSDNITSTEDFNNVPNTPVHSVSISGKTLVFDNSVQSTLSYDNRQDIKNMTIYAETVIIRSPLRLLQTDVTIYAKELRFEDVPGKPAAYLSTTPNSLTTLPAGLNGNDGLKAGNITLHISSYYADPGATTRLILHGGDGQIGAQGANGIDGHSFNNGVGISQCNGSDPSPWGSDTVYISTPWGTCGCVADTDCPTDGMPAIESGRPGNGGAGGNLLINNIMIEMNYDQTGGVAKDPAPYHTGGNPGLPVHSVYTTCIKSEHLIDYCYYQLISEKTTIRGADDPPKSALVPIGAGGQIQQTGNAYSWLHPLLLKQVLAYANNQYLLGFSNEVGATLAEYATILDEFKTSAEWSSLSETTQLDLNQMYSEIRNIQHRIASNLDYFGNPAGWVPMLSLEANLTAYQNEIEPALRLWYLSYWLTNKASNIQQKIDAMTSARSKQQDDIAKMKIDYNNTIALIPTLQTDLNAITNEISVLTAQLQSVEQELQIRAQHNCEPPLWKQAFGILGGLCSIIPVGQPVLGAIGAGLTTVTNLDFNDPIGAIKTLAEAKDTFKPEDFTSYQASWDNLTNKVTALPNSLALDQVKPYAKGIADAAGPVIDQINKYKGMIEQTQVPKDVVEKELARLKASDPVFIDLSDKAKSITDKKETFARKLQAAEQSITTLSNGINTNLLSIDSLDSSIVAANGALDHRLVAYLKTMERNSKERLLRYHYYMKKAYEYRLLKQYPGDLDLDAIFNKMIALAATKISTAGSVTNVVNGSELSSDEFLQLKPLFENQISAVAASIYDQYNSTPPTRTAPVRFALTAAELQNLNAGTPVVMNLVKRGRFNTTEENIRIVDLKVYSLSVEPVGGSYSSWADIDVEMQHSGLSKLTTDGKVYQFAHYNDKTVNPLTWGVRYDAMNNIMNAIVPSAAATSLLRSLLLSQGKPVDDMMLFSRPAAWADIIIMKSVNTDNGVDIAVKNLVLELTYDFATKPTNWTTLQVKTADTNLTPVFGLGTADQNGRKEGLGDFYRTYTKNSNTVSVEAPANYGTMEFVKWTNKTGTTLSTNPALNVSLSADQTVIANYKNVYQAPLLVTLDGTGIGSVTPNSGTLSWNGSNGTTTYLTGTVVTLTPAATTGSSFLKWGGECAGAGVCNVTMDKYRNVTATFTQDIPRVEGICGDSNGGVFSTAPSLNLCNGGTPSASGDWNWDCVGEFGGETAHCSAILGYLLSVTKAGSGTGSVLSSSNVIGIPGDINCPGVCSVGYPSGSPITLTTTTSGISTFTGWSSAECIGTAPCILAMLADKSVTANFGSGPAKAKVNLTGYATLGEAYNSAGASATIRIVNGSLGETLNMDQGKNIVMNGGYDSDLSLITIIPTILKGKLTIKSGSLRSNRIKVSP